MSMTDPIADMLTRIRNGIQSHHERVELPASKLKVEIARILKSEGFISNYKLAEEGQPQGTLRIDLKYSARRRAGHPRHRAHLAPGPPRLPQQAGDPARARRPRAGHRLDLQGRAVRHTKPSRAASAAKSSARSGKERPMSRIGKKEIPLPKGVEVKHDGNVVTVKGPKGTLTTAARPRHRRDDREQRRAVHARER